jgi:hypothetical protein
VTSLDSKAAVAKFVADAGVAAIGLFAKNSSKGYAEFAKTAEALRNGALRPSQSPNPNPPGPMDLALTLTFILILGPKLWCQGAAHRCVVALALNLQPARTQILQQPNPDIDADPVPKLRQLRRCAIVAGGHVC